MDAGLIVVATASDLGAEDFEMIKEVIGRDSVTIAYLGKKASPKPGIDLTLRSGASVKNNVGKILTYLKDIQVFKPGEIHDEPKR